MQENNRRKFSVEFKREAVDLVLGSNLTTKEISTDLGIGLSTLTRWIREHRDRELAYRPHDDSEKELARLRKENRFLRAERDLLKKATAFFAKETSR